MRCISARAPAVQKSRPSLTRSFFCSLAYHGSKDRSATLQPLCLSFSSVHSSLHQFQSNQTELDTLPSSETSGPAPRDIMSALPQLTFYTNTLAFHPAKVAMLLAEKKLPHKTVRVDLFGGGSLTPQFLKISPNAVVPVLVEDGKVILESKVICQHLDTLDQKPLGGDQVDRAFVDQFVEDIDRFDGNLWAFAHMPPSTLGLLTNVDTFRKKVAEARAKQHPDMADVYQARIQNMGKLLDTAKNDPAKVKECEDILASLLDTAEKRLTPPLAAESATDRFLGGTAYSLADAMFAPILFRVWNLGQYQQLIAPRQEVAAYMKRMRARPSWQAAFGEASSTWGKVSNFVPALISMKVRSLLRWY